MTVCSPRQHPGRGAPDRDAIHPVPAPPTVLFSWQLRIVAVVLLPLFVVLQVEAGRVRRPIVARTQRPSPRRGHGLT